MDKALPLSNWSLKKALDSQTDTFTRARIRIIFTILLFSLSKAAIVIAAALNGDQPKQVVRACVAFVVYGLLVKLLLYRPSKLTLFSHIIIVAGILVIWTNVFVYAHKVNLITVQFAFMAVLSSFYILGNKAGIVYSTLSSLPILVYLFLHGNVELNVLGGAQEIGSPGYEIIVVLNFVTIIVAHYLFFKAIIEHISEKDDLNVQLKTSIAQANKLAASRSEFLSTMSHELRTPLNSVVGLAELLLGGKPAAHQVEDLRILHLSALDLLSLINNVLDFNKADSDKLELGKVSFNLAGYTRDICSVLKVKAKNKHLVFALNIDTELEGVHIVSDPTRLSQILYNLIGNAIKFTEKGVIKVDLEVVDKTEKHVEVLFSIQDTGIGISQEKHETIFEMFSQAETAKLRKYGGTGLGLAIVKHILPLFGSTIKLDSTQGQGSRFYFTVKFERSESMELLLDSNDVTDQDLSQLRILVAEDDDINRLVLNKQMENIGVRAVVVENGVLAYEAYVDGDFDAVFLDLHMPLQGGYETLAQIRALADTKKSGVYAIAFTASVTEEQKIFESGFDDFLYKPTNLDDLQAKLEKVALKISIMGR